MDYEIYLNCPDMLDTVVTNIRDFIQETLGEEMTIYNDPSSEENEYINMDCSLYQVSVTSIELFPASLWPNEKEEHIDVTVNITFWFYNRGDDYNGKSWHVFRLFLVLSRLYPGDAVLYFIGSVIYRKTKAGLYIDDGKGEDGDYYVKLFEREWKRKRDGVSLPFQCRTQTFPDGEDCLSIDFDKGYELLTVFLVFEAIQAYPAIYKALTGVLNQRSAYQEIVLRVCSLEIHPDTTKIMDTLAKGGEERFCEIATEELLFLIQIWADELDMRLRLISREEMEAELDEMAEEAHRKIWGKSRAEMEKAYKEYTPNPKKSEGSKWKSFWKKLRNAKTENETQEIELQESKPPESEKQGNESQEMEDIIHEAYDNKVCIIENAYMGRAKNGMQIAMFLNDAGEIRKAFPVPHDTLS